MPKDPSHFASQIFQRIIKITNKVTESGRGPLALEMTKFCHGSSSGVDVDLPPNPDRSRAENEEVLSAFIIMGAVGTFRFGQQGFVVQILLSVESVQDEEPIKILTFAGNIVSHMEEPVWLQLGHANSPSDVPQHHDWQRVEKRINVEWWVSFMITKKIHESKHVTRLKDREGGYVSKSDKIPIECTCVCVGVRVCVCVCV